MTDDSTAEVEQLNLKQEEPMSMFRCDLCDATPESVDMEWVGPGEWRHQFRCPECDRETSATMNTGCVMYSTTGAWEDMLTRKYVESSMSVEALERSLDRLHGVGDHD